MTRSSSIDFYRVLGVDPDASDDDIKRAYHRLARAYHPDLNPDNPAAEERLKAVNKAYEVLSDPNQRAEYDATLVPDTQRVAADESIWHEGRAGGIRVEVDLAVAGASFGLGLANRLVGGLDRVLAAAERAAQRERSS